MRLRLLVLGAAALLSSPAAGTAWGKSGFEASLDIGSRRELFVDYHLVGQLRGTRLKLHVPRPGGVAISYERPWEDWYSFYTTILKDGDTYRMYYRCGLGAQSYTCYAESRDGIRWTRPSLGLFEAQGSRENNVILDSGHQFCPFIDGRPGVPAAERYKANMEAKERLLGYVSAAGIRWKLVRDEAIVPRKLRNHFDSQNVMFWSEAEELYGPLLPARRRRAPGRGAFHFPGLPQLDRSRPHDLQRYGGHGPVPASLYQSDPPLLPGAPHLRGPAGPVSSRPPGPGRGPDGGTGYGSRLSARSRLEGSGTSPTESS